MKLRRRRSPKAVRSAPSSLHAEKPSPAILQPMDPTKPVTVNDSKVEVAEFHKDNVERAAAAGGI